MYLRSGKTGLTTGFIFDRGNLNDKCTISIKKIGDDNLNDYFNA